MPISLGADSRISRWAERIILPPTALTGIAITPIEHDGTDEAPTVHVDRK